MRQAVTPLRAATAPCGLREKKVKGLHRCGPKMPVVGVRPRARPDRRGCSGKFRECPFYGPSYKALERKVMHSPRQIPCCHPWLLDSCDTSPYRTLRALRAQVGCPADLSGTNPSGTDLHTPAGCRAGWPGMRPCRNDEQSDIHSFTLSNGSVSWAAGRTRRLRMARASTS
jgi:hypothetical protein